MDYEFLKHLDEGCILRLEGETKRSALEELIAFAVTRCTLDEAQLRELIWKREKMMTTGVGKGLALPHIRLREFPVPLVAVGICRKPVTDYKSLDNEPIRLIVFIAADESDQAAYLKLLGSVSSCLKNPETVSKVLACADDPAKVIETLSQN